MQCNKMFCKTSLIIKMIPNHVSYTTIRLQYLLENKLCLKFNNSIKNNMLCQKCQEHEMKKKFINKLENESLWNLAS